MCGDSKVCGDLNIRTTFENTIHSLTSQVTVTSAITHTKQHNTLLYLEGYGYETQNIRFPNFSFLLRHSAPTMFFAVILRILWWTTWFFFIMFPLFGFLLFLVFLAAKILYGWSSRVSVTYDMQTGSFLLLFGVGYKVMTQVIGTELR